MALGRAKILEDFSLLKHSQGWDFFSYTKWNQNGTPIISTRSICKNGSPCSSNYSGFGLCVSYRTLPVMIACIFTVTFWENWIENICKKNLVVFGGFCVNCIPSLRTKVDFIALELGWLVQTLFADDSLEFGLQQIWTHCLTLRSSYLGSVVLIFRTLLWLCKS